MAIAESNSATLADNGVSNWVTLRAGENLISVSAPTWGVATTIALQFSDDATEATMSVAAIGDDAVVLAQANGRYVVDGPGYIRAVAEDFAGSDPISITRIRPA